MTFFDTNLLVYSTVNLDQDKQDASDRLIEKAIKEKRFSISPLILSELVFVLAKLKIDKTLVEGAISLYKPFVQLMFAEKYCSTLLTFDRDFEKFKHSANIKIDIL